MVPTILKPSRKGLFLSDVKDDVAHILVNTVDSIKINIQFRSPMHITNLHHMQLIHWERDIIRMQAKRHEKAKSIVYWSILVSALLRITIVALHIWISRMVVVKAMSLTRDFPEKKQLDQHYSARWLIRLHGLLYWIGTHISQRDPRELEQRALQFIEKVHPAATRKDQDYVINKYQSPIPFTFDRQSTLELVGMRTVDIHKSMGDSINHHDFRKNVNSCFSI